jgi:hypothetical protein
MKDIVAFKPSLAARGIYLKMLVGLKAEGGVPGKFGRT